MYLQPEHLSPKQRLNTLITPAAMSIGTLPDSTKPLDEGFMTLIQRAHDSKDFSALRIKECAKKMGRAKSTYWKDVKDGVAPPSIRLGKRSVGWLLAELDAILAARAFASQSKVPLNIEIFVSLLTANRLSVGENKSTVLGPEHE